MISFCYPDKIIKGGNYAKFMLRRLKWENRQLTIIMTDKVIEQKVMDIIDRIVIQNSFLRGILTVLKS